MESKFLGVTTKLDIMLTTGKRSHNALDVAVLSLVGLLCDRVGSLLYSTVCSLCYVFDTVCRYVYILSTLSMHTSVLWSSTFYQFLSFQPRTTPCTIPHKIRWSVTIFLKITENIHKRCLMELHIVMLQDTCTYMHSSLLAKDDDPLTMDSHPCLAKMIHIKLINFSAPFSMLCFTNLRENW